MWIHERERELLLGFQKLQSAPPPLTLLCLLSSPQSRAKIQFPDSDALTSFSGKRARTWVLYSCPFLQLMVLKLGILSSSLHFTASPVFKIKAVCKISCQTYHVRRAGEEKWAGSDQSRLAPLKMFALWRAVGTTAEVCALQPATAQKGNPEVVSNSGGQ